MRAVVSRHTEHTMQELKDSQTYGKECRAAVHKRALIGCWSKIATLVGCSPMFYVRPFLVYIAEVQRYAQCPQQGAVVADTVRARVRKN